MSGLEITDPEILSQIPGMQAKKSAPSASEGGIEITDPEILKQINAPSASSTPRAPMARPHPAMVGPTYGARLGPEDQAIAEKLAARKTFASSFAQGFTLNFADEIKAGVEAIPSAIARGSSPVNEYYRILNVHREAQRMYENQNPTGAGVAEFVGSMANPLNRLVSGPISTAGEKIGGYVASKIPARWGAKSIGAASSFLTEAALHGAAFGGASELGKAENVSPSGYVPTAASGALEGAEWGPVGAVGLAGIVKSGAYGYNRVVRPLAGAAGRAISPLLPEAPSTYMNRFAENISHGKAAENVAGAIEEIGNTINERNEKRGRPTIDPLEAIRQEILPEIPARTSSRARGIRDLDHAENIIANVDAFDKNIQVTPGRGGITEARRQQVLNTLVEKNLTPEQRAAEINSKSFLNPEQKRIITESIIQNPIESGDRIKRDKAWDYYKDFKDNQRTPSNIIEHASAIAKDSESKGAEMPILELARVAAGAGGAEKSALTANLAQRQTEQGSRMAQHIEKAASASGPAGDFQNLDQARQTAERLTSTIADEAYTKVRANKTPIDLSDKLAEYTRIRMGMTGDAGKSLGEAINDFRTVHHKGAPYGMTPEEMSGLRATFKGHEFQSDVSRFLGARNKIDDAIDTARGHSRKILSQFRTDMNEVARTQHPDLLKADNDFSEGKSIEKIVDTAHKSSEKLNYKSEDTIKYFDSLNPEQQTLFRMAFANKLKQNVSGSPENSAFVGGKFTNDATREMIEHIFGKKAGKTLNTDISREAATTQTLAHAFSGSRTAPMQEAISRYRLGAELPVSEALSWYNPARYIHTAADLLKYQIANRQANHIGKILSNTDPVDNLREISILKRARTQAAQGAAGTNALAYRAGARYAPLIANVHQVGIRPEQDNGQ